ncbi:MAG: DUF4931 domain-containing protein [candidate division WOR-3 bacterium]|nr:DUF4931 domain-containing protein [candidate division WOR-3 bacterium]
MTNFRKDPLYNRWVLMVPGRGKRPHAFYREKEKDDGKVCPFCEGREEKTPPEIDSFRVKGKANEPGWKIRVVPNKYPALTRELKTGWGSKGLLQSIKGYGTHEVIIETPSHSKTLYNMNEEEISLIFKMYRKRTIILKEDKNLKCIFIFKNYGRIAGASFPHSHSQILGLPLIPPFVEEEIKRIKDSLNCIYCHLILKAGKDKRILTKNSDFIALAPYASLVPYQITVFPLEHKPYFEEISDAEINSLSRIIKEIFQRYNKILRAPAFNFFIHTFPRDKRCKNYHYHLQIMPKLTIQAGFEMGSGIFINPVPPKTAIRELKS